ncbi:hypothetical protein CCACVL1_07215 [Corchorus capsularis]|uniref:Uncharacterized protein n=1 Tax=Corchorus capsularis TaxID=210143 RepID=A0A1R3J8H8_COCAP|nr:hypothetical protein CCACVL1_07215 [Corchorus capsularis]
MDSAHVAGHYLTISRWKPLFRPYQAAIRTIDVWVRLLGLPIEFFSRSKLVEVGNLIGKIVKVDKSTEESSRGKYARICMEVYLGKPLVGSIMMGPVCQRIEYEGLEEIRFKCGIYGHKTSDCHQRFLKESHKTTITEEYLADRKMNNGKGGNES